MRLPGYQLDRHLQSKQLAPIYVISSDELLLKQEVCAAIRNKANHAGFTEYQRFFINAETDWESVFNAIYSVSLFQTKRFLDVDETDINILQTTGKRLENYAQHPLPDSILLLRLSKLDKKLEKKSWLQALEKTGVVIPLWPPFRNALPQWISQRAKSHQLTLTTTAINLLAASTEGNLSATAQTLEKLALMQLPNPIDEQVLASVLTEATQFTIFDFAENMLENPARALCILDSLCAEGVEPTLVLWAITRELRMLATCTQEQRIMLFPARRHTGVQRLLKKYCVQDYWQRLLAAAHIDRIIKGVEPGDPWEAMAKFIQLPS